MKTMEKGYKDSDIKEIDISVCEPTAFNPNEQDDATFNLLCDSIKEDGFTEPILVTKLPNERYRIISGEHRWRACMALGWTHVPAILLNDFSEEKQKYLTVRMNALKGKLNYVKLADLVGGYAKDKSKQEMARLLGITDDDKLKIMYDAINAGLPIDMRKRLRDLRKEIRSINDLSLVLNKLFREYGSTLDRNFMFFVFGGKEHILVTCDERLWKSVKKIAKEAEDTKRDINDVFLGSLLAPDVIKK